jgi:hypothetical protein
MELSIEEIDRGWFSFDLKGSTALKFSIKGKEGSILLSQDARVNQMWDLHFNNFSDLSGEEKEFLVKGVIDYIEPGYYLGTCGDYVVGSEMDYRRFSWNTATFRDTGMLRTLKSGMFSVYFPILQKK